MFFLRKFSSCCVASPLSRNTYVALSVVGPRSCTVQSLSPRSHVNGSIHPRRSINTTEKEVNSNEKIIALWKVLESRTANEGNLIKSRAYTKAIETLKKLEVPVKSGKEAGQLSGIGKSLMRQIDEILQTGKLQEVIDGDNSPKVQAMTELSRVTGIGPQAARRLIDLGITTLEELKKIKHRLSHHQQIGLKYVDEFETPIPRSEMMEWEKTLSQEIQSLSSKFRMTICGSYRRGLSQSGDIDILLTHDDFDPEDGLVPKSKSKKIVHNESLSEVLKLLKDKECLTDDLAVGHSKYMGVCKLLKDGAIHRRIDIRFIPKSMYPFGILYFTGDKSFVVDLRKKALRLGYTLSEYSLVKKATGEKILLTTEQEIFDFLEVKWKSPEERNS
ncbi:hypothetical protein HK098_007347 [Nowakowskiella sp. JEL0407]|nr:hypothetical protein HK098_007347 [Nowakowskiella sp. JEL0407]